MILVAGCSVDTYSPASLPDISSVEVVSLEGVEADRADQYMDNAAAAPSVRLDGDAAQRIAALWRRLPPGEQARCHTPPFGLRFRTGERVVCQASLCWECNNSSGNGEGRRFITSSTVRKRRPKNSSPNSGGRQPLKAQSVKYERRLAYRVR